MSTKTGCTRWRGTPLSAAGKLNAASSGMRGSGYHGPYSPQRHVCLVNGRLPAGIASICSAEFDPDPQPRWRSDSRLGVMAQDAAAVSGDHDLTKYGLNPLASPGSFRFSPVFV